MGESFKSFSLEQTRSTLGILSPKSEQPNRFANAHGKENICLHSDLVPVLAARRKACISLLCVPHTTASTRAGGKKRKQNQLLLEGKKKKDKDHFVRLP